MPLHIFHGLYVVLPIFSGIIRSRRRRRIPEQTELSQCCNAVIKSIFLDDFAVFDVLDEVQRTAEESYPPYNIERLDENRFQISVALAGFMPDEVALTVEQNVLTLEGRKSEKEEKSFLHRGISARN
jgi:HSP20 family molecular chaperone IbpA